MSCNKGIFTLKVLLLVLLCSSCGPQKTAGDKILNSSVAPSGFHHPGANIHLLTRQVKVKEAGDTESLNIRLRVGHTVGLLSIRLSSSEGVSVLGKQAYQMNLDNSGEIEFPVEIYASANGRHYLPINVVVELPNGQRFHRAVSVVVQVGRVKPMSKARRDEEAPVENHDGQLIKVLPATEEIK